MQEEKKIKLLNGDLEIIWFIMKSFGFFSFAILVFILWNLDSFGTFRYILCLLLIFWYFGSKASLYERLKEEYLSAKYQEEKIKEALSNLSKYTESNQTGIVSFYKSEIVQMAHVVNDEFFNWVSEFLGEQENIKTFVVRAENLAKELRAKLSKLQEEEIEIKNSNSSTKQIDLFLNNFKNEVILKLIDYLQEVCCNLSEGNLDYEEKNFKKLIQSKIYYMQSEIFDLDIVNRDFIVWRLQLTINQLFTGQDLFGEDLTVNEILYFIESLKNSLERFVGEKVEKKLENLEKFKYALWI